MQINLKMNWSCSISLLPCDRQACSWKNLSCLSLSYYCFSFSFDLCVNLSNAYHVWGIFVSGEVSGLWVFGGNVALGYSLDTYGLSAVAGNVTGKLAAIAGHSAIFWLTYVFAGLSVLRASCLGVL